VPLSRRVPPVRLLALRSLRPIQPAVRRDASILPELAAQRRPVWRARCQAVPAGWPDRAVLQVPCRAVLLARQGRKVPQARFPAAQAESPDPKVRQVKFPVAQAESPDPVEPPVAYQVSGAAASHRLRQTS
jgi:hypothetical protein